MATSRGWMVESWEFANSQGFWNIPVISLNLDIPYLDFGNSSKSNSLGVWRVFFMEKTGIAWEMGEPSDLRVILCDLCLLQLFSWIGEPVVGFKTVARGHAAGIGAWNGRSQKSLGNFSSTASVMMLGWCQSHHWNRLAHGGHQNGSWPIAARAHAIWDFCRLPWAMLSLVTSTCIRMTLGFFFRQTMPLCKDWRHFEPRSHWQGCNKSYNYKVISFKLYTCWVVFWFSFKWSTLQGCQTRLSFHHLGLPSRFSVVIFNEDLSITASYGDSKHDFKLIWDSNVATSYFNRRWFQDMLRVCIWSEWYT